MQQITLNKNYNNIRLILTENCNATCPHCFNANVRDSKNVMDVDKYEKFISSVHDENNKMDTIKLMGGEPSLHPHINEFIKISFQYAEEVALFTNGKNFSKIDKKLLKEVGVIINSFTLNEDILKNALKYKNVISIHNVVRMDDPYGWIEKLKRYITLKGSASNFYIIISPDTSVNIWNKDIKKHYQEIYVSALKKFLNEIYFEVPNINFKYDHLFPLCFFDQYYIDLIENKALLNSQKTSQAGCCSNNSIDCLVDTDFNIWYCNQCREQIGKAVKEDGSFINSTEYQTIVKQARYKRNELVNIRPECKECAVKDFCKMGCYYNTYKANYN